jgi:hypothetical protein
MRKHLIAPIPQSAPSLKTVPQVVTDAMNQLEARIARAAVVQQVSVNLMASA